MICESFPVPPPGDFLAGFRQHIVDIVLNRGYASEDFVVNAFIDLTTSAKIASVARFATLKTEVGAALAVERKIRNLFNTMADNSGHFDKSSVRAPVAEVKFLQLHEYLTNYDTTGEITNEDMRMYETEGRAVRVARQRFMERYK
jgi:hypothetical protein